MSLNLKEKWFILATKLNAKEPLILSLWDEIEKQYTLKIRHYHNLDHLNSMLCQAENIKESIVHYEAFSLAIWYHDIIYKPTKKDNEERSALLAKERLKSLGVDKICTEMVETLIVSTKKHEVILEQNDDNKYLLDADLSILGSPWNSYKKYTENIRKEYAIYPNFMYKKGRKQVLQHFLERPTLYFTDYYRSRFEIQARDNLKKELELLN